MKKVLLLPALLLFCLVKINAQTVANVEGVFGGSISAINGGFLGSSIDSFRVIIATQSANSIFYSNVFVPHSGGTTTIDSFRVLNAASSTAGFGNGINKIAYHSSSGKVFFIASGYIYSAGINDTLATKITASPSYTDVVIKGNSIYEMSTSGSSNTFYAGTINSSGIVSITSTINILSGGYTQLVIGKNDKLFAFREGTDPQALMFGGTVGAGINLFSTSIDSLKTLSSLVQWAAFNVYTDGTVFAGGNNTGKVIARANAFNGTYTTINTGITGNSGDNIEFRQLNPTTYYVYFGSAYSNNNGNSGSWQNLGNVSYQTHPNDGAVYFVADNPNTGGVLLLTTDQGIGITTNSGSVITEVDEGVNAVQVKDFDMNATKDFGWLASKSGIRYVQNYNTAAKSWSKALFPNSDGSPYYAVEMVDRDTAYVGNTRIYKTANRGTSWSLLFDGGSGVPNQFSSPNATVSSIAIGGTNNSVVMAGYRVDVGVSKGGVIYSLNHGQSWNQLFIHTATYGSDVNVNDIEITFDSGKVVAYIGVQYDNTVSPVVRGMYKAVLNGNTWVVTAENMYNSATALYTVKDIMLVSKDTIIAAGAFYNSSLGHEYPIHFAISKTTMNKWSSSVVDTARTGTYSAISWSGDTLFYAYINRIYWDRLGFHSAYVGRRGEALYYSVPVGTDINVLFYDELLAGTETDIRSVRGATTTRPTATIKARYAACTSTIITGGSPGGGIYYLVDTTADGYIVQSGGLYSVLFASDGVLTGETCLSFADTSDIAIAFPTLHIVWFNPVTTFSNTAGTYIIAYTNDTYATSSSAAIADISSYPTVASITGTTSTCGVVGSTSYLYDATASGVWASSNIGIATIDSTLGKLTVAGGGTTVISYTVTNSSGCSAAAIANFTVNNAPLVNPTTGANNICRGSTTQLTNTTGGGVWSTDASNVATVNGSGLVNGVASSPTPVNISYTVTSSAGCTNTANFVLLVSAYAAMPAIAYAAGTSNPQVGANSGFCRGRTFTVVGSPSGGAWSSSNTALMTVNPGGVINLLDTGTATLTYSITNSGGCTSSRNITGRIVNCPGSRGISMNDVIEDIQFSLYPNPAKTFIRLNVEMLIGNGTIAIADLYGKQLLLQPLSIGLNKIDISKLTKGIYIATLITEHSKETRKIIVD